MKQRHQRPDSSHLRQEIQASRYAFPYHWIPDLGDGHVWRCGRSLRWGQEYLGLLSTVIDLVTDLRPRRVLDFGCGDGRLAYELLASGIPEMVGIDVDDRAVAFASAFCKDFGARAKFLSESIQNLQDGGFDVAIAMEVLEHITDEQVPRVLEALQRHLASNGRFVLTVPTTNIPLQVKHERHYTEESLTEQLNPWFEVVAMSYVHRRGWMASLIRKMMVNRFCMLVHPWISRLLVRWYRRSVLNAGPQSGAHLLAVCRVRTRGKT